MKTFFDRRRSHPSALPALLAATAAAFAMSPIKLSISSLIVLLALCEPVVSLMSPTIAARPRVSLFYDTGNDDHTNTKMNPRRGHANNYSLNCGAPGSRRPLHMVATSSPPPQQLPTHGSADASVHNFADAGAYLNALDANEHDEELLVVNYYASYCKICQRSSINYKKIANEMKEQPLRLARLEVSRLPTNLLKKLGLTRLPFVQIFRHGKCVASFSTGPSHMFAPKVRDTLQTCLARTQDEWDAFLREFDAPIQENIQSQEVLRDYVRERVKEMKP